MPSEQIVVGLDVGTTKVNAIIAEIETGGELRVIGVGTASSEGLRRGVIINIEATLKSVIQAIESAEMMSGREVQAVQTGIAGGHIEGINSRGVVAVTGKEREITRSDVDRVIEAAKAIVIPMDREVFHVIPQEYIVDDQGGIKNPLDMIGVRLEAEVHIVTGSVTSAQNIIKCINRAGFKVDDLVLESLAASRAVLSHDEKELGVLLIDLGGGTTDMLVHLDGAPFHTHVVSIGGEQVTSDISIMLKTPIDAAEQIKRKAGCAYLPIVGEDESVTIPGVGGRPPVEVPRREIARIIQPRMAEIFRMVREQVDKKGYLQHLGGGVVLTGGGSLMPGVVDLAQEVFELPARIGSPTGLGGLVEEYQNPQYATGVGLVLYAADRLKKKDAPAAVKERVNDGLWKRMKQWFGEFF
ncbi:MAG: cell division protein FtsA [Spirochaetales bacterium]|nr:cell division protein FtsA [Spirochaetales bacterium]MCF7937628.1 cell division protein FtsA [Spirochaetales bacterium]